jgi:hypothetical protein
LTYGTTRYFVLVGYVGGHCGGPRHSTSLKSDLGLTQVVIVDSILYYDAVGADYIDRVR